MLERQIKEQTDQHTPHGPNRYVYVDNNPVKYIDPLGTIKTKQVVGGIFKIVGGGFSIAGGIMTAETGLGLFLIPIGESAIAWGAADVVAGFADTEVPYSGTVDLAIQETTFPGFTREALQGVNTLSQMLVGQQAGAVAFDSFESVFQSAYSIYESGSTIKRSLS